VQLKAQMLLQSECTPAVFPDVPPAPPSVRADTGHILVRCMHLGEATALVPAQCVHGGVLYVRCRAICYVLCVCHALHGVVRQSALRCRLAQQASVCISACVLEVVHLSLCFWCVQVHRFDTAAAAAAAAATTVL
jgi:hypothetical protein